MKFYHIDMALTTHIIISFIFRFEDPLSIVRPRSVWVAFRHRSSILSIKSLLNIADSRFQRELVNQAIEAGKLDADYTIPEAHRGNTPEKIASFHKAQLAKGLFPAFPFACAFSNTEQRLISALAWLSDRMHSKLKLAKAAFGGLSVEQKAYEAELGRMGLDTPQSLEDRLYKALLLSALNATEINP